MKTLNDPLTFNFLPAGWREATLVGRAGLSDVFMLHREDLP